MTDKRKDEMPNEIWIDTEIDDGCVYTSQWREECTKYVRADLSPPVPDDVAAAIRWTQSMWEAVSNKAPQDEEAMAIVLRAASTPRGEGA